MANQDIEIEIKLPLLNPEELSNLLDKISKPTKKEVYQKDTYFTPSHRNFLAPNHPFEWLRIRESIKGKYLTYKHQHPENDTYTEYIDEYETKIESVESLQKILKVLDFKEIVIVEKYRSTWEYKDTEIAIDNVTNLGFYIEIEAFSSFSDNKEAKKYLMQILGEIGAKVGAEEYRSYPKILLDK